MYSNPVCLVLQTVSAQCVLRRSGFAIKFANADFAVHDRT